MNRSDLPGIRSNHKTGLKMTFCALRTITKIEQVSVPNVLFDTENFGATNRIDREI